MSLSPSAGPRSFQNCPDAPAGDTEEEAVGNAKEGLELWFEPSQQPRPLGAKILEVTLS